ncbi:uncharacterized protein [Eurosta solidaginis]|uniref:uncharacterized protein n=1 Tax=Eurosta solidaginis TaxID=178769 RepID=UPI0035306A49
MGVIKEMVVVLEVELFHLVVVLVVALNAGGGFSAGSSIGNAAGGGGSIGGGAGTGAGVGSSFSSGGSNGNSDGDIETFGGGTGGGAFGGVDDIFQGDALQCYTCSNCEIVDDSNELQNCSESASANRPSLETDYDGDYSEEDFEDNFERSGKIIITNKSTNSRRKSTKDATSKEDDSAEIYIENDEYDYNDKGDGAKYQLLEMRANEAVCYMVKLKAALNDTIVTKRGCSTMVRRNNLLTCESLSSVQELVDCQICKTNGCNKFFEDDGEWQSFMNNSENLTSKIRVFAFLPFVLLLSKYLI